MRALFIFIFSFIIGFSSCSDGNNSVETEVPGIGSFDSLGRYDPDYVLKLNYGIDNDALMRQLKKEPGDSKQWRAIDSLYFRLHRFRFYISQKREEFRTFCGDATGATMVDSNRRKVELTNKFFIENKNADEFFGKLGEMKKEFLVHSKNDSLTAEISKLDKEGREVLKDIIPLAAIAKLYSFEIRVVILHNLILKEYLKKLQDGS